VSKRKINLGEVFAVLFAIAWMFYPSSFSSFIAGICFFFILWGFLSDFNKSPQWSAASLIFTIFFYIWLLS
jgi:hypothetical protein